MKIAIAHEIVQLLSDKSDCVDVFEENDNSFDGCMYAKLNQLQTEQIGCTVPWLLNRSNICTEKEKRKTSFSLYQSNRRNQVVSNAECLQYI